MNNREGNRGACWRANPWAGVSLLSLLLLGGGCAELESLLGGSSGGKSNCKVNEISAAPYTTTGEIQVSSFSTSFADLTVDIPSESEAMGIVVQGTSSDILAFIEHDGTLLGDEKNKIRGPGGQKAPLAFNTINDEPSSSYFNNEAGAVHFPNDGCQKTLKAGTWTFPVGAADASTGDLVADTLTPYVYYKTVTSTVPTLKLNVFVVDGVGGIGDQATAASDPEILGAIDVLNNVYANNSNIAVNVETSIRFLTGTAQYVTTDIDANEQFLLQAAYPSPAEDDAMNIFIVGDLGDGTGGVIGLAGGIPGPFNIDGTAVSGTLAEYQGDGTGTILGFTLAHEFGHYLGLYHTSQTGSTGFTIIGHDPVPDTDECTTEDLIGSGGLDACPDRNNLMFPFVDQNNDPPVSVGQGNVVKFNPGVLVP